MKILITGNMGYVGSVLTKYLRERYENLYVVGFDTGYFGHCLTAAGCLPETRVDYQYIGDLRMFPRDLLDGVHIVVHLAAISNDPIGSRFEAVTRDINTNASATFAQMAKDATVSRFIFASSCSSYGTAEGEPRKESDVLNPLTAYAKSKVAMEDVLAGIKGQEFHVTCLRFATACGMSDRLRLDLAFNDFVASAMLTGAIDVLSDGTPWRPLVHVRDMARAIDWAIQRDHTVADSPMAVNVGSENWTYQMSELASKVAQIIPEVSVTINQEALPDKRSYKVDFSLFERLAPDYQPVVTIEEAVTELCEGLNGIGLHEGHFRDSGLVRLKCLEKLIADQLLNDKLYWTHKTKSSDAKYNRS